MILVANHSYKFEIPITMEFYTISLFRLLDINEYSFIEPYKNKTELERITGADCTKIGNSLFELLQNDELCNTQSDDHRLVPKITHKLARQKFKLDNETKKYLKQLCNFLKRCNMGVEVRP